MALYLLVAQAAQEAEIFLRSAIPRPPDDIHTQIFVDAERRQPKREVWSLGHCAVILDIDVPGLV